MNISDILAGPPPELPRRSSSNVSLTARSPSTTAAKLPTPPSATPKPMSRKRKRTDPKPIWAILEHEDYHEPLIPIRPPPSVRPTQPAPHANGPPPPHARPPQTAPHPPAHPNGLPPSGPPQLAGFERPVSDDAEVYNEITRAVCDFLWDHIIENHDLRKAVSESPGTEIEIEARWGQIIDRESNNRLSGVHSTECVVKRDMADFTRFESTMSLAQHRNMNKYLNEQVAKSSTGVSHINLKYQHTRESDMFYDLTPEGLAHLPPAIQTLIRNSSARQRIRVTRDTNTGAVLRKIIKHRILNMEISSPRTEWDYRIGINLEIEYPGPIEDLQPVIEKGRSLESMERKKDRMSYRWMGAYQIDLTQVTQGPNKNHELELELDAGMVIREADNIHNGLPSDFERLVGGMMNNLRVLSRQVALQTPKTG
ncbi:mRNA triphosphatase CET1 [Sporormia fimetaria CBS 119925]|uniref:mRNA-capping enzyme subunit beta n=1 Tax=Sporormia fimetaria CBS 119925 TaxID=1340428 RepID=A0A6A6VNM1_9PLEO|nr:mRNA triphosphatase CET1 [Sporormia fimetaria CBS 119925]